MYLFIIYCITPGDKELWELVSESTVDFLLGIYTNPGFLYLLEKSARDLVYPEQNQDVGKILRNLIGCLEDQKLEKTDFSQEIKFPGKMERC